MRVRELSDWPPSTFGVVGSERGTTVPTHAQQITIGDIEIVQDKSVSFKGKFDGDRDCRATIHVPNREAAEKMAAILKNHKGENLLSIGEMEIPTE